jgi:hypothetical protein
MAKQDKVPGMREAKPNREQRRHPEKAGRAEDTPMQRDEAQMDESPSQDVETRAKNSRHKHVTADKWNQ